jgi:PPOX class probable FMN-dependent enzyme
MPEVLQGYQFADVIESETELRAVIGTPLQRSVDKAIVALDDYCKAFIARSPFVLIASCDAAGNMDISPKGDPAGFVRVLDDNTLVIPDRPGNRRGDTLSNVLENPNVALYFLVPGHRETLRVVGRACIVRDGDLRESMAVNGKAPALLIGVSVQEVFFHCAKCIIRSNLWDGYETEGLASIAEVVHKHANLTGSVEELAAEIEEGYRSRLY